MEEEQLENNNLFKINKNNKNTKFYTPTKGLIDFLLGFVLSMVITYIVFATFVNFSIFSVVVSLFIIYLLLSIFKINRKFTSIGIISFFLIFVLIFGGCLSIMYGNYNLDKNWDNYINEKH